MKTTEVRITDPYVIKVIESHRQHRGQRSRTATAGDLILERNAQIESQSTTTVPGVNGGGMDANKVDASSDAGSSSPITK